MKQLTDGVNASEIVAPEKAQTGLLTAARVLFLRLHQRQNTERVKVDIFEGAGVNHHVELRLDVPREAWGGRAAALVPEIVEKEIGPTADAAVQKLIDRLAEAIRLRVTSDLGMLRIAGKPYMGEPIDCVINVHAGPGEKRRGRLPFDARDEGEGDET